MSYELACWALICQANGDTFGPKNSLKNVGTLTGLLTIYSPRQVCTSKNIPSPLQAPTHRQIPKGAHISPKRKTKLYLPTLPPCHWPLYRQKVYNLPGGRKWYKLAEIVASVRVARILASFYSLGKVLLICCAEKICVLRTFPLGANPLGGELCNYKYKGDLNGPHPKAHPTAPHRAAHLTFLFAL